MTDRTQLLPLFDKVCNEALASRLQVRASLSPIIEPERFRALVEHGFKVVGAGHTLISDSGFELLRLASQGKPRLASQIIKVSLRLAVPKGLNHLPDELIEEAIGVLQ
jgi:type II secretory pathway predicted ATPase ExeA